MRRRPRSRTRAPAAGHVIDPPAADPPTVERSATAAAEVPALEPRFFPLLLAPAAQHLVQLVRRAETAADPPARTEAVISTRGALAHPAAAPARSPAGVNSARRPTCRDAEIRRSHHKRSCMRTSFRPDSGLGLGPKKNGPQPESLCQQRPWEALKPEGITAPPVLSIRALIGSRLGKPLGTVSTTVDAGRHPVETQSRFSSF